MKRVKRFGVYQTSKVAAIIMFFIALIFMIPFGLIGGLIGGVAGNGFSGFPFGGGFFFIVMPFLYGIIGFIMTAISCLIYNLIAKWTGGIELEFDTVDE
jgi:hypothetical protein